MSAELPIRLARSGEDGIPFIAWLDQKVGRNRIKRERLTVFIEQWCHLRDGVQDRELREPSIEEYAEEWRVTTPTAYRIFDEFRRATGINHPGDLCTLLWDGMPVWTGEASWEPKWLLAAEVVES